MSYIAAVGGTVVLLLGTALYFTGQYALAQHDRAVTAEHVNEINQLTATFIKEKQEALASLQFAHDGALASLETSQSEAINDLDRQLLTARNDALQNPIEFGDDIIREFIRVDCLWSIGEAGNSVQGRETCSREAETADPASTGIFFTTITPTFLTGWENACEDWTRTFEPIREGEEDLTYTRERWVEEYGNFDVQLCGDSIVAMTPELSLYLRKVLTNAQSYTGQLIEVAVERGEIIDLLQSSLEDKK